AKGFLDEIEKHFAKNDKVEMTSLLSSLMSMKYKGQGNVREYIMEMFYVASRLKALKIKLLRIFLFLCFWYRFLHNLMNSKLVTTVKRRNGL
ncbi:hypothetical protein J1N35_028866, partial [Gossypium stocksii]